MNSYPTFLCPNCRAVHDLEKEIEDDDEEEPFHVVQQEQSPISHSNPNRDAVITTQSDPDDDNLVHVDAAGRAIQPMSTPNNSLLDSSPPAALRNVQESSTPLHEHMGNLNIRERPSVMRNPASEGDFFLTSGALAVSRDSNAAQGSGSPADDMTIYAEASGTARAYVIPPRRTTQGEMNISMPPASFLGSPGSDGQPNTDVLLTPRNNAGPFVLGHH